MRHIDIDLRGGSFDFFNKNTSEPVLAGESDIRFRASLVQDVIDRLIDKKFGKLYLEDLRRLNSIYRIEYKFVNGLRVCASSKIAPTTENTAEIGNFTIGANSSVSYDAISQPVLLEERDIQLRAEMVQQVIDRVLDQILGKEFLFELLKLNEQYPVGYQIKDGVRTYKAEESTVEKVEEVAVVKVEEVEENVLVGEEVDEESLVALSSIVKDVETPVKEEIEIQDLDMVVKTEDTSNDTSYSLPLELITKHIKEYLGNKKSIKALSFYKPEVLKKIFVFNQDKDKVADNFCPSPMNEHNSAAFRKKTFTYSPEALEYNRFIHFIRTHGTTDNSARKREWKINFLSKTEK